MAAGRERDGIFETEDCINIIEATTSRRLDKAAHDGEKLAELARDFSKKQNDKAVRCFFVTKYEPTAEQRTSLKKQKFIIYALSFSQFQQRLVNASEYLTLRDKCPFGSAADPATDSIDPASGYVDLDILEEKSEVAWPLEKIKNFSLTGSRIALLGDYGAGKSMSLREVYRLLRTDFFKNNNVKFPVYINLREHQGQVNPAEVFLRHSNNIGFRHPDHLVRAWRAGYVVLLLDGFDEIGTTGMTGQWKKLRDLRYRAMEVVRAFHRESPGSCGVIVAGRAHFFDSEEERGSALGAGPHAVNLTLNDFSEQQIETYLEKFGIKSAIPSWLPRRPLLLGYLVAKQLIGDVVTESQSNDAASGWDILLDRIATREAKIEAGIDWTTLRRVIERIATKARVNPMGLGPIYQKDLSDAFFEICGYHPNETAMVLLQRLPGLGVHSGAEESRVFIHEDLTDVCRVGDVYHYVVDPFSTNFSFEHLECLLGEIGQEVLSRKLDQSKIPRGKIETALRALEAKEKCNAVLADLAITVMRTDTGFNKPVYVKDVVVRSLDLAELKNDHAQLFFQDCLFSELELAPDNGATYPRFSGCYIGQLLGRVSAKDLPIGVFDSQCVFERFDSSTSTNSTIMDLDLPIGHKVLLSILRKIYVQKGSGRRQSALVRGLDERARRVVPEVLHILKANELTFAAKHGSNNVWYPVRNQTKRVYAMINSPSDSADLVIKAASEIVS